jgi:hypothetical protein
MTTCSLAGLALGQSTLIVRSLDENYQKTVSITVKACASTPDIPTGITFSKTGIKLNEEITATATPEVTSGGAVPTKYIWTIPTDNFDITGDESTRVITLKAKAAGTLHPSTTNVSAQNTCGISTSYSNRTTLRILDCSTVPNQPGGITINPTSVVVGSNFTATIQAVASATGYTWNEPSGLTIVSGQNTTSVTYKTSTTGTIPSGAISVYASNACGPGTSVANLEAITVAALPCSGYTVPNGVFSGPDVCSSCASASSLKDFTSKYGYVQTSQSLCVQTNYNSTDITYEGSYSFCAGYNSGGDTGWRVPNAPEVLYLVYDYTDMGWDFTYYWSSTQVNTDYAFKICANVYNAQHSNKLNDVNVRVRCVKNL